MAEQTNIYSEFSNFMTFFNKTNSVEGLKNINSSEIATIIETAKVEETINKKQTRSKCGICKVKINAVDAIISSCKCNKNYCKKHRMPEMHFCDKINEKTDEQKKDLEIKLVKVTASKLSTI